MMNNKKYADAEMTQTEHLALIYNKMRSLIIESRNKVMLDQATERFVYLRSALEIIEGVYNAVIDTEKNGIILRDFYQFLYLSVSHLFYTQELHYYDGVINEFNVLIDGVINLSQ